MLVTLRSISIGSACVINRAAPTSSCQNGYSKALETAIHAVRAAQATAAASRVTGADSRVRPHGQAPAQLRLRGLAPARPSRSRPGGLGRPRPRARASGSGDLRPPRRARGDGDVLRSRHHRRALPGPRPGNRGEGARRGLPRIRARAGPPAEPRRVPQGCRALRRCARGAHGQAAARVSGARVLDHARHAVGLRRPGRARFRVRLEPVRLAAHPAPHQPCAAHALPAGAPVRTGALGVPDHRLASARTPRADRRRRILARAPRPDLAARVAGGGTRELVPCAVLPPVRARPASAAGGAARERNSAAATARRLEERAAQSGQAARRGSDSCASA